MEDLRCPMLNDASSRLKYIHPACTYVDRAGRVTCPPRMIPSRYTVLRLNKAAMEGGCVRIPISSFEASAVVSRLYRFTPTVHLPLRGGAHGRQSILHEANFFTLRKTR